ncbi:23S rRNA (uracil(1939)-C(5))-methyltransferase RlmD [Paracrocinitomix mangrovi]|uniref:23S rRNA (uracil(1939)-C(5))-methyltransferase RlmD n=1 Tax=Paracrocinitomix mangrovi TaxID=2862509 RepID=UPI001C8E9D59|nr:23S rRNA (uracil(1939)-C(5))-methyltransferase RlmD [Paracrocinitomix mangrovi]UKN02498.1 23S rRNA (uracil(1939)-C(5))-methyltransferase RlmD [Paracrocinitomix mangrovi]
MKRGDIIEVEITDYAFGGKGIAKQQTEQGQYVIFVENTYPGQVVEARIAKKRKKHAECKLLRVIKDSPIAVDLGYQPISGAPYIKLPVDVQHKLKQESTLQQYKRIGDIQDVEDKFESYIASPADFNYRNKMEYSFSSIRQDLESGEEVDDAFALGFKTRGTWWKVENLDKESGLFDKDFENKLHEIREFLATTNLPAWHPPQKKGFFRHLVVRKSFDQDQLLINLVTSSQGLKKFDRKAFADFMQNLLGKRLAGLQHTINDDVSDRAKIENGNNELLFGETVVLEKLLGLNFEISMESFFQTNPKSAERLYAKAIEYAQENFDLSNQYLMDLFCGTGTIGQIMASKIEGVKVVGVDIVPEAIEDAKRNAKRNKIGNLDFYAADVGKFLNEYPNFTGKIHTIILDPPRAGIAPKTLKKVMAIGAKQIVYISCNPATQARDAKEMDMEGYKLKKLSLVDQFPHTSHIEAVALFIKE